VKSPFPVDTPYEGKELTNWPRYTILRGKVIWANGKIIGKPRDGQYLKRGKSVLSTGLKGQKKDVREVADWLYDD
jgi:dihydropyrimidinase